MEIRNIHDHNCVNKNVRQKLGEVRSSGKKTMTNIKYFIWEVEDRRKPSEWKEVPWGNH